MLCNVSFRDNYIGIDLNDVPWDSAYVYENVEDIWDHWYKLFVDVIDQHMPYKKKYIRGDQPPWITSEISHAISRRNRLLKKFRKNRSNQNWDCYRKQRNLVTTLKRKSLKSYCIQASAECIHPGEFWKKFQPLLPSKCVNRQSINLLEDGQLLTDETKVANTLEMTTS